MYFLNWCSVLTICILNIVTVLGFGMLDLSGVPKMSNDPECNKFYSDIVHHYFLMTTIVPKNSSDIEYCVKTSHNHRQRRNNDNPYDRWDHWDTDLAEIIEFYNSLPHVTTMTIPGGLANMQYGALYINDFHQIPVFARGEILYSHTTGSGGHNFPSTVQAQMELMGQRHDDDRGHLLARSLGGSNEPMNVIPMATNLNRHRAYIPENHAVDIPRSYWRSNEDWILRFLRQNRRGRVNWQLALRYQDVTIIDPARYETYRPLALTMQFDAFTDQFDPNSLVYHGPQITFFNDNDYACGYDAILNRFRRSPYNQKCEAVKYPPQPQGKMGFETSHGEWTKRYEVGFGYEIAGRQYFYCQSIKESTYWFIQELLPRGVMGEETQGGHFPDNYQLSFPFSMDGKQYFYGHCTRNKKWVIRELLPGGRMGTDVSYGTAAHSYKTGFPFSIQGKYYVFLYSHESGSKWYIQELLAGGGGLGAVTDFGTWQSYFDYSLTFPFVIRGRQFFYGHSAKRRNWFIQELLPGGVMGEETDHGVWAYKYEVSFPFLLHGQNYFYGHSVIEGGLWFIQELLPNGKMGKETDHGNFRYTYGTSFPFVIDGQQYFYGHSATHYKWFIQKFQ